MKHNRIKAGKLIRRRWYTPGMAILFVGMSLIVCICALSSCSNPNFEIEDNTIYPYLESVEITKEPKKLRYEWGESLDLSGLEVTGSYSDGASKKESIKRDQIIGYNPYQEGEQSLDIIINHVRYPAFSVTVSVFLELTTLRAHPGDSIPFSLALSAPVKVELINSAGKTVYTDSQTGESIALVAPNTLGRYTIKLTVTLGDRIYSRNYRLEIVE
jgi:hypothetical protein